MYIYIFINIFKCFFARGTKKLVTAALLGMNYVLFRSYPAKSAPTAAPYVVFTRLLQREMKSAGGSDTVESVSSDTKASNSEFDMARQSAGAYSLSAVVCHIPDAFLPIAFPRGRSFRIRPAWRWESKLGRLTNRSVVGLGLLLPIKPCANVSFDTCGKANSTRRKETFQIEAASASFSGSAGCSKMALPELSDGGAINDPWSRCRSDDSGSTSGVLVWARCKCFATSTRPRFTWWPTNKSNHPLLANGFQPQ